MYWNLVDTGAASNVAPMLFQGEGEKSNLCPLNTKAGSAANVDMINV